MIIKLKHVISMLLFIFSSNIWAVDVLHVNAQLAVDNQIQFQQVPFIMVVGEPTTWSDPNGRYQMTLQARPAAFNASRTAFLVSAQLKQANRNTLENVGSGQVELIDSQSATLLFEGKQQQSVAIQLELKEVVQWDGSLSSFGEPVR